MSEETVQCKCNGGAKNLWDKRSIVFKILQGDKRMRFTDCWGMQEELLERHQITWTKIIRCLSDFKGLITKLLNRKQFRKAGVYSKCRFQSYTQSSICKYLFFIENFAVAEA